MSTPNPHPLEAWRLANGLTVTDAAIRIKVRRAHWYELINRRCLPRKSTAQDIEAATGISRAALAAALSDQQETPTCKP